MKNEKRDKEEKRGGVYKRLLPIIKTKGFGIAFEEHK